MNKSKNIFILLLTILIFSACANTPATENKEQDDAVNENIKISFMFSVAEMPLELSFLRPECAKIKGDNSTDINKEYCKKYYDSSFIDKNNFQIETSLEAKDIFPSASNIGDNRCNLSDKSWDEYIEEYNNYINEVDKHKISLFLVDAVGKDEVGRWYLTKNTNTLTKDELICWNFCKADCNLRPEDIVGDYILWQYNLSPATGTGDQQTKYNMIKGLLNNVNFEFN